MPSAGGLRLLVPHRAACRCSASASRASSASRPTSAPSRTSDLTVADRRTLGEVRPQQPLLGLVLSPVRGRQVDQLVRLEGVGRPRPGRSGSPAPRPRRRPSSSRASSRASARWCRTWRRGGRRTGGVAVSAAVLDVAPGSSSKLFHSTVDLVPVGEPREGRLEAALADVAPRTHDVRPDLDLHADLQLFDRRGGQPAGDPRHSRPQPRAPAERAERQRVPCPQGRSAAPWAVITRAIVCRRQSRRAAQTSGLGTPPRCGRHDNVNPSKGDRDPAHRLPHGGRVHIRGSLNRYHLHLLLAFTLVASSASSPRWTQPRAWTPSPSVRPSVRRVDLDLTEGERADTRGPVRPRRPRHQPPDNAC